MSSVGNDWRWCDVCGAGYVESHGHPCIPSKLEYKPPVLRELSAPETLTKLLEVLTPEDRLKVFENFCCRCGFKLPPKLHSGVVERIHSCPEADPFR